MIWTGINVRPLMLGMVIAHRHIAGVLPVERVVAQFSAHLFAECTFWRTPSSPRTDNHVTANLAGTHGPTHKLCDTAVMPQREQVTLTHRPSSSSTIAPSHTCSHGPSGHPHLHFALLGPQTKSCIFCSSFIGYQLFAALLAHTNRLQNGSTLMDFSIGHKNISVRCCLCNAPTFVVLQLLVRRHANPHSLFSLLLLQFLRCVLALDVGREVFSG